MKNFQTVVWLIAILATVSKASVSPDTASHPATAQYSELINGLLANFGTSNKAVDGSSSQKSSFSSKASSSSRASGYGTSGYKNSLYGAASSGSSGYNTMTSGPQSSGVYSQALSSETATSMDPHSTGSKAPSSPNYHSPYSGSRSYSSNTADPYSYYSHNAGSKGSSLYTSGSTGHRSTHGGTLGSSSPISSSTGYHYSGVGSGGSGYGAPGSSGYRYVHSSTTAPNTHYTKSLDTGRVHSIESGSGNTLSSVSDLSELDNYGVGDLGYDALGQSLSSLDTYGIGAPSYGGFNPIAPGGYTGLNSANVNEPQKSVEQVTWRSEYQGVVDVHHIKDDGNFSDSTSGLDNHHNVGSNIVSGKHFGNDNTFAWNNNVIPGSSVHLKFPGHKDFVKTEHVESKQKIQHEIHTIKVVLENKPKPESGSGGTTGKTGGGIEVEFTREYLQEVIKDCWESLPTCPATCQNTTILCEKVSEIGEWPSCVDRVEGVVDEITTYFTNGVWKVFSSIGDAFNSVFG